MFDHLKRLRTAKGFGVHSPFAFNFITNVLFEKYSYYAYFDIPQYLSEKHIDAPISSIHQLFFSYRELFSSEKRINRRRKARLCLTTVRQRCLA